MRKLQVVDVSDVDTQHCVMAFNERAAEFGITDENIVTIQRVENENPPEIHTGSGKKEYAKVTLYIFYWTDK